MSAEVKAEALSLEHVGRELTVPVKQGPVLTDVVTDVVHTRFHPFGCPAVEATFVRFESTRPLWTQQASDSWLAEFFEVEPETVIGIVPVPDVVS